MKQRFGHIATPSGQSMQKTKHLLFCPIDVESIRARVTRKYESFKKTNPTGAILSTNMTQWQNFSLEAAYHTGHGNNLQITQPLANLENYLFSFSLPCLGHFFWARHVRSGDVVDIKFTKNLNIRAVYIVTGFDKEEERAGTMKFLSFYFISTLRSLCKCAKIRSTPT